MAPTRKAGSNRRKLDNAPSRCLREKYVDDRSDVVSNVGRSLFVKP
jgi:hypothetical protein